MSPHGVEVFVAIDLIDLRWGFHRLSGVVTERLGREVRSGALFVFFGKRRDAIKVLFFDGTGVCLFYKRLDAGTFRIPEAAWDGDAAVQAPERGQAQRLERAYAALSEATGIDRSWKGTKHALTYGRYRSEESQPVVSVSSKKWCPRTVSQN